MCILFSISKWLYRTKDTFENIEKDIRMFLEKFFSVAMFLCVGTLVMILQHYQVAPKQKQYTDYLFFFSFFLSKIFKT